MTLYVEIDGAYPWSKRRNLVAPGGSLRVFEKHKDALKFVHEHRLTSKRPRIRRCT